MKILKMLGTRVPQIGFCRTLYIYSAPSKMGMHTVTRSTYVIHTRKPFENIAPGLWVFNFFRSNSPNSVIYDNEIVIKTQNMYSIKEWTWAHVAARK